MGRILLKFSGGLPSSAVPSEAALSKFMKWSRYSEPNNGDLLWFVATCLAS
jgi:hypothetical protein